MDALDATRGLDHVLHAEREGCGGILDAIEHFGMLDHLDVIQPVEIPQGRSELVMVYHRLPYDGTVDWPFIAGILASRNAGPALNLEVSRLTYAQGLYDPAETRLSLDSFLAEAYKRAARLARERNARWADARSAQGRDS